MSWNFFDSWRAKRVDEKLIKCSEKEVIDQEFKSRKSYDSWQECADTYGFNDPICREKRLEKYYKCMIRLNRMKNYIQDKDLHSNS